MSERTVRMSSIVGAVLLPALTVGQVPPDPKGIVGKSLAPAQAARLCLSGGQFELRRLIGELGLNAGINIFALPPAPRVPPDGHSQTAEQAMVGWIIATDWMGRVEAEQAGLRADEHEKLSAVRFDLVEFLRLLPPISEKSTYVLAPGSSLGESPEIHRAKVLESFFAPLLPGHAAAGVSIACAPMAYEPAKPSPQPPDPRTPRIALRGKIDDLAAPRYRLGSATEFSEAFTKASEATGSFSDNGVKNERAIAAELVLGYGWQLTPNDGLVGFVHYYESTAETEVAGDDDDGKDIRALSPGVLYRRSIGSQTGRLFGTAGLTVYPTYDRAQDARLLRARAFLNDIALKGSGPPICGSQRLLASRVLSDCRLSVFAEYGYVMEAGTNVDWGTAQDDDYTGLGTALGATFSLAKPAWAAPFALAAEYRYLHIIDGTLRQDPERFSLELRYRIPKSNVSISLSRSHGENPETFQDEDLVKLSFGFKY